MINLANGSWSYNGCKKAICKTFVIVINPPTIVDLSRVSKYLIWCVSAVNAES
jgi:hypothetical protein